MRRPSEGCTDSDAGLTLIEMVIAVAILAVLVTATGGIFISAAGAYRQAAASSTAEQAARGALERLQGLPWDKTGFYTNDPNYEASYNGEPTVVLGTSAPAPRGAAPLPVTSLTVNRTTYNVRAYITWVLGPGVSVPPAYDSKRLTTTVSWTVNGRSQYRTQSVLRAPKTSELPAPGTPLPNASATESSALSPGGGTAPLITNGTLLCPLDHGCLYDPQSDPATTTLSTTGATTTPVVLRVRYKAGTWRTASPQWSILTGATGAKTNLSTSKSGEYFTATIPTGTVPFGGKSGSKYGGGMASFQVNVDNGGLLGLGLLVTTVTLTSSAPINFLYPVPLTSPLTATVGAVTDNGGRTDTICVDPGTRKNKYPLAWNLTWDGVEAAVPANLGLRSSISSVEVGYAVTPGGIASTSTGTGFWEVRNTATQTVAAGGLTVTTDKPRRAVVYSLASRPADLTDAAASRSVVLDYAC